MRKITLDNYEFEGATFHVAPSLADLLFHEPKLSPREVIARDELARKIEAASGDILLEDAEYAKLVSSLDAADLKTYGRSIVEFIRRILDAPKVEVAEKV